MQLCLECKILLFCCLTTFWPNASLCPQFNQLYCLQVAAESPVEQELAFKFSSIPTPSLLHATTVELCRVGFTIFIISRANNGVKYFQKESPNQKNQPTKSFLMLAYRDFFFQIFSDCKIKEIFCHCISRMAPSKNFHPNFKGSSTETEQHPRIRTKNGLVGRAEPIHICTLNVS